MYKILIVEDERAISDLIRLTLRDSGYQCTAALTGREAADLLEEEYFDLVLLDIMLPEIDGYELMEYIRPLEIPVIFLTAKHDTEDKVRGLRAGAEDYIAKPFAPLELTARVETVLRRFGKVPVLHIGGLEIDTAARIAYRAGTVVSLTKKEFDLLVLFATNRNMALYRDVIYERVWGEPFPEESKTVDLHVQRLRKKVGWERSLVAVNKIGYRLEL